MSVKNIVLNFMAFIAIISAISTEKENGLFNPLSFLSEKQKMISFSTDIPELINIKCLYSKDYNVYSLQTLQKKDGDYETKDSDGNKVFYNFCQNTKKSDTSTVVKIVDNDKIVRLAGSIEGEGDKKNKWTQVGEKEDPKGIEIELVPGDECKTGSYHQTTIKIKCDSEVENMDDISFSSSDDGCLHTLEFSSVYGCTLRSNYLFLRLLKAHKIIFCVLFVLLGLIICFFGQVYLKFAIIILCGLLACYGICTAILNFFPDLIRDEFVLLIWLIVFFVIGSVIGFYIKDSTKIIVAILGGFIGYLCSNFLYQIVQNYYDELDQKILYFICIGVCILIGAVLGYCLSDYIIILATAVLGAYLIIRGISFVFGHYLDEEYLIDLIKNKEWEQLRSIKDIWTLAYLGVWIVLSVAGIIVQCKTKTLCKICNGGESSSTSNYMFMGKTSIN